MLDFSTLNVLSIASVGIVLLGAIVVLVVDMIVNNFYKGVYIAISIVFLAFSLMWNLHFQTHTTGFFDLVVVDGMAILSQFIIIITSIIFLILLSQNERYRAFERPSFYSLFLLMVAGFEIMTLSNNLVLILLGLELSSLIIYSFIALANKPKSLESSIKYFVMGAMGSGILAFGIMMFYASFGSVEIAIDSIFPLQANQGKLLTLSMIFLLCGIGVKVAMFPFHTWVSDVYESSNPALVFYISIVPKIAAFIVALKIIDTFLGVNYALAHAVLIAIVVLTMSVPNVIALLQDDIKRMLAFSSISQSGVILACIVGDTYQSIAALFLYWILFAISNLGAFGMIWILQKNHDGYKFSDLSGIAKTMPLFALSLGIFMLSLAGIPPFGLFWGKMSATLSLISAGHSFLAFVILFNSALAVFYYLKLVIYMFLSPQTSHAPLNLNLNRPIIAILMLCVVLCVFAIFFIQNLFDVIYYYLFNF